MTNQFDHEVDVLIVGSGNGAMTSALASYELGDKNAQNILIVEKSHKFGGTSALSGGGVWVPNNRYAKAKGAKDSYDDALTYLKNTIPEGMVREGMHETYLKSAPEMVDFIHNNTRLKYMSLEKYPDYFTDLPGAKTGHRSMEPKPINFSALGKDMTQMLDGGAMYIFGKYGCTQEEARILSNQVKGWKWVMFKMAARYTLDFPWWLVRKQFLSRRTCGGGAGIIRLFLSLRDRKIPLWLNTKMEELIKDESGSVVGVVVSQRADKNSEYKKTLRIKARKAVVLAAGGFEHNQQMREQYLPQPTSTSWSAACKTNTGDAIRAGQDVGAATSLMNNAWWCTTKGIPGQRYPMLSIINKSLPGSIVVNKAGKRFSNESQNYMSFLKDAFAAHTDEKPCIPMYMVFDERFRKVRAVWPALLPEGMMPKNYFDSGFMAKAETPEKLAEKLGVDPEGLKETIERFNQFAQTGVDEDFKRGDAAYDRYYGDKAYKPNPCLSELSKPPFWAIRLDAGDFGTQGGMVINEHAQVIDSHDNIIEGLYACGNCTSAVLPTYPGPGSTLGPAMTFAYLAAKHIAGKE